MNLLPFRKSHQELNQWHPFDEMAAIHERINQLFGQLDGETSTSLEPVWTPLMDVIEDDDTILLKLDTPGMEKKDISVEMEDGNLVIQGERKHETKETKGSYTRLERGYGSFMRSFSVPDYIDQEAIKASCKNGILEVSLKKVPGKKKVVKTIAIE